MDIEKAIKEFDNYVNNFDINNSRVKYKYYHSKRVSVICGDIAKSLNLSDEEIMVAKILGLLHDIGRFNQVKKHDSFLDSKTLDHGEEGVRILKTNNYIRKYLAINNYDDIIYTAINNHNKKFISKVNDEKALLFSKIIRDADKIDILYAVSSLDYITLDNKYSEEVIQLVKKGEQIDIYKVKYKTDDIAFKLGFVNDINFLPSLKMIKEKGYVDKIMSKLIIKDDKIKEVLEDISTGINRAIKKKLGGYR